MKLRNLFITLALLLCGTFVLAQAPPPPNGVLPSGTEIKVRTDVPIPAKPAPGTTFDATVSHDVLGGNGAVIIPQGSRALLAAVPKGNNNDDTILDLQSVFVNGARFDLVTNGANGTGAPGGIGANQRTAKYVGGGAAIGALLGAIFGGGKGAAIGALAGAGAGAGTQVYTGRNKQLPAETQLSYKLAQDLVLQPYNNYPPNNGGLQPRH